MIKLTDKQRKWLESLSDTDRIPWPKTVNRTLSTGQYSHHEGILLNEVANNYKKKYRKT